MNYHLRLARPVLDLAASASLYCRSLNLHVLGQFENHEGFDGIMLGNSGWAYHLELTRHRSNPVVPSPTPEDLLVWYIPDQQEWLERCRKMVEAGFRPVVSVNPYWNVRGRTFADLDGYRLVLQNDLWESS